MTGSPTPGSPLPAPSATCRAAARDCLPTGLSWLPRAVHRDVRASSFLTQPTRTSSRRSRCARHVGAESPHGFHADEWHSSTRPAPSTWPTASAVRSTSESPAPTGSPPSSQPANSSPPPQVPTDRPRVRTPGDGLGRRRVRVSRDRDLGAGIGRPDRVAVDPASGNHRAPDHRPVHGSGGSGSRTRPRRTAGRLGC